MASAPSASWNSRCITHLANCPNRSLPTNSSDESELMRRAMSPCSILSPAATVQVLQPPSSRSETAISTEQPHWEETSPAWSLQLRRSKVVGPSSESIQPAISPYFTRSPARTAFCLLQRCCNLATETSTGQPQAAGAQPEAGLRLGQYSGWIQPGP